MKAVVIEPVGEGTRLAVRDVPEPVPGPTDLLVDVRASALNRADLRRAPVHFSSSEKAGGPAIGGLEMAGMVVATGSDVQGYPPGTRVMAMIGSSWAQKVIVDYRLALTVPHSMDWTEAAATPVSFVTGYDALVSAGHLTAGEHVLVRGASSAAGLASIQIARVLGARPVFGTTSSVAKLATLAGLGCEPLDASTGPVAAVVRDRTAGHGADLVLDIVGAGAVQDNIDAAAITGRIVCVGRLAGPEGTFNLDEFSRKRITMIGVTFRTRTFAERAAAVAAFREQMLDVLASGAIRPVLDRAFPLSDLEQAERYMRENRNFGKVIIEISGDRRPGAEIPDR